MTGMGMGYRLLWHWMLQKAREGPVFTIPGNLPCNN